MKTTAELLAKHYTKIVLARAEGNSPFKKIVINELSGAKTRYQAAQYTDTQVTHRNFDNPSEYITQLCAYFKELYLWGEESYSVLLKHGEVCYCKKLAQAAPPPEQHNRERNYPIMEGQPMPVFQRLGIYTSTNAVVAQMRDKFKQINRYIQLLEDVLGEYNAGDELYIVDYGCGKSYLSFAVYHYFTTVRKLKVTLDCIDLKAQVIADCSALAQEYGYDGMHFFAGDIRNFIPRGQIDLAISLHACDVATDYVLYGAVSNKAKKIFAVPCCQHEAAKTLSSNFLPQLTDYGILKERLSAMLTDAIRCRILELLGYKVELLEFVDLTDSPKNLLIRATTAKHTKSFTRLKRAELEELLKQTDVKLSAVSLLLPLIPE